MATRGCLRRVNWPLHVAFPIVVALQSTGISALPLWLFFPLLVLLLIVAGLEQARINRG
ncbi:MAG: hypothetical protein Phyf2KO_22950 [Phycisphaerales bacterium]